MKWPSLFFLLTLLFNNSIFAQTVFNNEYIYNTYPVAKSVFALSDTGYAAIGGAIIDNKALASETFFKLPKKALYPSNYVVKI